MSWAQVRFEVFTHKKTGRLARLLKGTPHDLSRFAAGGLEAAIWAWAATNAKDGDMSKIEPDDLAFGIGYPGTGEELLYFLKTAGLLDAGKRLHDWMEHTGKSLQARDAKLKAMNEGKERKRLQGSLQEDRVDALQDPSTRASTMTLATLRSALPCSAFEGSLYEEGESVDYKGAAQSLNGKHSSKEKLTEISEETYYDLAKEIEPYVTALFESYNQGSLNGDFGQEVNKKIGRVLSSHKLIKAQWLEAIRKFDPPGNAIYAGCLVSQ